MFNSLFTLLRIGTDTAKTSFQSYSAHNLKNIRKNRSTFSCALDVSSFPLKRNFIPVFFLYFRSSAVPQFCSSTVLQFYSSAVPYSLYLIIFLCRIFLPRQAPQDVPLTRLSEDYTHRYIRQYQLFLRQRTGRGRFLIAWFSGLSPVQKHRRR